MKGLIALIALMLIAAPALAQRKDCEELKSEIEAKIKANYEKAGAKPVFTLEIVPNDVQKDGQVVGTCDGGTKKIIYTKG